MRVLAVDTTSPRASVAVADETGLLAEERAVSDAGHSRWLLGAVDATLARLSLQPGDLDLIAVTSGPGSFTGLRVGIASVQGLALASGRPCLGIPTLDVWAHEARGALRAIVVVLEAFRGEVFWAVYDGDARLRGERHVSALDVALAEAPAGSVFTGDAALAHRGAIEKAAAAPSFARGSGFLAAPLARMALGRATQAGPPAALLPVYLRGAAIRPPRA